jgi:MFS family permease
VHGRTPDYGVAFAPTPHPLATAVGALGALFGTGFGEGLFIVLGFFALGLLGWLVYALGAAWFTPLTGVVAAAIVLTREPVLSYGVRAYVDIPYICLLLGALLAETRRPRAGTVPLVLLALAGLLRPEAWLFAVVYAWWLWRGGALTRTHVALVVGAPLLWALSDLLVTGDPLHSLTGTRSTAESLGRVTGLQHVPTATPRRLGEILREPVLFGAAVGGVLSLWRLRTRGVLLGAAAGVLAIVAFAILATAGLSILTRYLLFPATILAIFAAAGVCAWTELPRDDPWRRAWMALAALTVAGLLVFIPSQVTRIKNTRAALIAQTHILDELHDFASRAPRACAVTVPNRRAVPQMALWTDRRPGAIRSAQEDGRYTGTAFVPVSPAVADQFVLNASDEDKALPAPPPGRPALRGRYWDVYPGC